MQIANSEAGSSRDRAVERIWSDIAGQSTLLKPLYDEMMDSGRVMSLPSGHQMIILFSQAGFAKSDDERVYVAGVFHSRLFDRDILPRVTEHRGLNLAARCLVSLSLFEDYMKGKYRRSVAPSPGFYREVGKSEFEKAGRFDVAADFDDWIDYTRAVLAS